MEAVRPRGHEGVGVSREVRAAGGVVWRRGQSGIEVLLIHRPRYGDWSFPKGKVKVGEGESDEAAAIREVEEEVGIVASLGPELESTTYRDVKGRKMELPSGASPIEGDGVDEWRWVPLATATDSLSWARDRAVLASLPVEELV
jgi:8-oxo-dGTP pyrophosphatase MutT (NUDIX family)